MERMEYQFYQMLPLNIERIILIVYLYINAVNHCRISTSIVYLTFDG